MNVKLGQEIVRQNNRDTLPGIWQVGGPGGPGLTQFASFSGKGGIEN